MSITHFFFFKTGSGGTGKVRGERKEAEKKGCGLRTGSRSRWQGYWSKINVRDLGFGWEEQGEKGGG